jgi:hypothetical protein
MLHILPTYTNILRINTPAHTKCTEHPIYLQPCHGVWASFGRIRKGPHVRDYSKFLAGSRANIAKVLQFRAQAFKAGH